MDVDVTEDLVIRVRRLEDEAAIRRLVMTYGPAADAGLAALAGGLWLDDGSYDWDADGTPHQGNDGVTAMLGGEHHHRLIGEGVAHFAGPLLVTVDGDRGTAVNYSLIMRREDARFYLWRVSAVRWDVERVGEEWKIQRRTNRLLDESGAGRELFKTTLQQLFGDIQP